MTMKVQLRDTANGDGRILEVDSVTNQLTVKSADGVTVLSTLQPVATHAWSVLGTVEVGDEGQRWVSPINGIVDHITLSTSTALDGDLTVELLNEDTAFGTNPNGTIATGNVGTAAGPVTETIARGDRIYPRVSASAATNSQDLTVSISIREVAT